MKAVIVGGLGAALDPRDVVAASAEQTLYNGIRLAQPWPPRVRSVSTYPVTPPYLVDPPTVIPIDVGRQLFVDDFLIEQTTLTRRFHRATYYEGNPVLRPETAWEKFDGTADRTRTRSNPAAMPFSDGVFYDPQQRLFKMWYMAGYGGLTAYATSEDGLHWHRPALDVMPGTNIVIDAGRDSSTVWFDLLETNPRRRYKAAMVEDQLRIYTSADGIHWKKEGPGGPSGDRTTFFHNPFRNVWVFSIRASDDEHRNVVRHRHYREHADFLSAATWRAGQPVLWASADGLDAGWPGYNMTPELYNLDAVAYESLMLGMFTIWRGERDDREKPNEVCVGFSRDGFHWQRPERRAFLPVSDQIGDWNWANVQSAGGCCLVVGDQLYFYVSGRQGVPGTGLPGVCSTGVAMLRRDGFASMDDDERDTGVRRVTEWPRGTLITRPVSFSGAHLFVNAAAAAGELRVEVLDREGRVMPPFTADACVPIASNGTRIPVNWRGVKDLSAIAGQTVRFRFSLRQGSLFAFWVSRSQSGASAGYLAAGGPGLAGAQDDHGGARAPTR